MANEEALKGWNLYLYMLSKGHTPILFLSTYILTNNKGQCSSFYNKKIHNLIGYLVFIRYMIMIQVFIMPYYTIKSSCYWFHVKCFMLVLEPNKHENITWTLTDLCHIWFKHEKYLKYSHNTTIRVIAEYKSTKQTYTERMRENYPIDDYKNNN